VSEEAKPVNSVLFATGTDFSSPDRQRNLLEQYKLLVQTSESVVARRQTVNSFFFSINTFLLSAIGILWKAGLSDRFGGLGIVFVAFTGILLCVAWKTLVRSFRQLNAGKFEIIHLLEQHLPASIFKAEWEALGAGKDKSRYTPFTPTEGVIPLVFGALYALASLGGVLALLGVT
jgi:tryptophan-rich sensory protein